MCKYNVLYFIRNWVSEWTAPITKQMITIILCSFSTTRQPVSTLVATTKGDILLTVAPVVPPMCVSTILATCECRGFQLRGVRRVRLNHNKAMAIGKGDRLSKPVVLAKREPQNVIILQYYTSPDLDECINYLKSVRKVEPEQDVDFAHCIR